MAQATGKIFPSRLWLPPFSVCTIVHGRKDETIEVEGSRKLYSSSNPRTLVKYIENDDGHGLSSMNTGTTLQEIIVDVNERFYQERPKLSATPLWWLRIKLIFFVLFSILRNLPSIVGVLMYKKKKE